MQLYENSIKVFIPPPHATAGTLFINNQQFVGTKHPNGFLFLINTTRVPRPNLTHPFIRWETQNGTIDEPVGEWHLLRGEPAEKQWSLHDNVLTIYTNNFTFKSSVPLVPFNANERTYYTNETNWPIDIEINGQKMVLPPKQKELADIDIANTELELWFNGDLDLNALGFTEPLTLLKLDLNGHSLLDLPELDTNVKIQIHNATIRTPISTQTDNPLKFKNCTFEDVFFLDENQTAEFSFCKFNHEEIELNGEVVAQGISFNVPTFVDPIRLNGTERGTDQYNQFKQWIFGQ